MTAPTRTRILWALAILIGAAAIWHLAGRADWRALARLDAGVLAALAASTLLLILLHALGAMSLLRALGARAGAWPVFLSLLAASTISLAGDPKLGIPARVALYKLAADVPIAIGAAQMLLETLLWFALMGLILVLPSPLAGAYALPLALTAAAIVLAIAAIILAAPRLPRPPGEGLAARLAAKLAVLLNDMRAALRGADPRGLLSGAAWLATTYVVDIVTIVFLAHALGVELAPLAVAHAIVIAYLGGAASLLPLGLGVRDIAFALLLQQAGAPAAEAAAIALSHRALRTLVPLALGAPAAFLLARRAPGLP